MKRSPFLLILLTFLTAYWGFDPAQAVVSPAAEQGVLDLLNWDWEGDGPVVLKGEWEFHWNRLLSPKDFAEGMPTFPANRITIPGAWNGHEANGAVLSGDGYATYRLRVRLPAAEFRQRLAFKLREIRTAYAVYVNGKKLIESGVLGNSSETMTPKYRMRLIGFDPERESLEIIVQVSNFHHRLGGLFQTITLGPESRLREKSKYLLAQDLFLFGAILIMGLYHLGLYGLIRRRDRVPLYFAGICFLSALRALTQGEGYLVELFPGMSWETFMAFSYLTFYPTIAVFCLYVRSLYPREYSRQVLYFVLAFCGVFTAVVVFTPPAIYTHTLQIFQIFTLAAGLHILYVLVRAALKKRESALIFIGGFLIVFATIIHDMLFYSGFIHTGHIAVFGIFAMIFSQSFLIYRRFSIIFFKAEQLSEELEEKNRRLVEFDRIMDEYSDLELRQARQRLVEMLNTLDEGIVSLDRSGEITFLNRKARTLFALETENELGKPVERLLPGLRERVPRFEDISAWTDEEFRRLSLEPVRINGMRKDRKVFPVRVHFRKLELEEEEFSLILTPAVQEPRASLLSPLAEEAGPSTPGTSHSHEFREQLVRLLHLTLSCWEQSTGKDKIELAEQSGQWRVQRDKDTFRARTLMKYLDLKTLPRRPRWKQVFRTANYVLTKYPLSISQRKDLEQAIEKLMQLAGKNQG